MTGCVSCTLAGCHTLELQYLYIRLVEWLWDQRLWLMSGAGDRTLGIMPVDVDPHSAAQFLNSQQTQERFCSPPLGEAIKQFSNFLEIHGLYVGGCVWKYAAVTLLLWVYANLHPSRRLARVKASKVFALHVAKPGLISGTPM